MGFYEAPQPARAGARPLGPAIDEEHQYNEKGKQRQGHHGERDVAEFKDEPLGAVGSTGRGRTRQEIRPAQLNEVLVKRD